MCNCCRYDETKDFSYHTLLICIWFNVIESLNKQGGAIGSVSINLYTVMLRLAYLLLSLCLLSDLIFKFIQFLYLSLRFLSILSIGTKENRSVVWKFNLHQWNLRCQLPLKHHKICTIYFTEIRLTQKTKPVNPKKFYVLLYSFENNDYQ